MYYIQGLITRDNIEYIHLDAMNCDSFTISGQRFYFYLDNKAIFSVRLFAGLSIEIYSLQDKITTLYYLDDNNKVCNKLK